MLQLCEQIFLSNIITHTHTHTYPNCRNTLLRPCDVKAFVTILPITTVVYILPNACRLFLFAFVRLPSNFVYYTIQPITFSPTPTLDFIEEIVDRSELITKHSNFLEELMLQMGVSNCFSILS